MAAFVSGPPTTSYSTQHVIGRPLRSNVKKLFVDYFFNESIKKIVYELFFCEKCKKIVCKLFLGQFKY